MTNVTAAPAPLSSAAEAINNGAALEPSVMTKEGLRAEAFRPRPERPEMPSLADYRALPEQERVLLNEQRRIYHSTLPPVATSDLRSIVADACELAEVNLALRPGVVRSGLLIDGSPNLGKTTIMLEIAYAIIRSRCMLYPELLTAEGYEHVPVVYISLPATATTKTVNRQICEFLAIPVARYMNAEEMTSLIRLHAPKMGVVAILIDDIHYLDYSNQSAKAVNNHIKHLMGTVPATPIHAGVNCLEGRLLSEGKNIRRRSDGTPAEVVVTQTASRFSYRRVEPFTIDNEEAAREWLALLRALESELILLDAPKNMLSGKLRRYLYERSNGEIGSLMTLIRLGVHRAIASGRERIDKELLDTITLNHAAEERRNRQQRNK